MVVKMPMPLWTVLGLCVPVVFAVSTLLLVLSLVPYIAVAVRLHLKKTKSGAYDRGDVHRKARVALTIAVILRVFASSILETDNPTPDDN